MVAYGGLIYAESGCSLRRLLLKALADFYVPYQAYRNTSPLLQLEHVCPFLVLVPMCVSVYIPREQHAPKVRRTEKVGIGDLGPSAPIPINKCQNSCWFLLKGVSYISCGCVMRGTAMRPRDGGMLRAVSEYAENPSQWQLKKRPN
eukprot:4460048-Pleurochrysis_carterae.AAC.5